LNQQSCPIEIKSWLIDENAKVRKFTREEKFNEIKRDIGRTIDLLSSQVILGRHQHNYRVSTESGRMFCFTIEEATRPLPPVSNRGPNCGPIMNKYVNQDK
jgi:hypothetical protein